MCQTEPQPASANEAKRRLARRLLLARCLLLSGNDVSYILNFVRPSVVNINAIAVSQETMQARVNQLAKATAKQVHL
jgi:hypothetical protein